jgi:hypothetical protein
VIILLDSNIFMYAGGAPHPAKEPCAGLMDRVAAGAVEAVIDAEVLQEILHRYWAIGRAADGAVVYQLARQVVPEAIPIGAEITDRARDLLLQFPALSARDALHAAVVLNHHLAGICSYDSDFDKVPGLKRYLPDDLPAPATPAGG